ncbi:uncharacterized protein E5676_scaffold828G00270 [Cucumis melo var. makuwa]|uniref:Uncharacterized protein n=1 Tax=Cucumis melo var. makuwa TaxID=1194695 RepID=A0A5A7VCZ5_CUCMM|nr:uncharacterized protein E6C27_scaffold508G00310 [Cucumis melo var. makuwa]TYK11657.1 uncharacterized protein E5676_scaffold828G00270 [Cucumis melo var. makuwa]
MTLLTRDGTKINSRNVHLRLASTEFNPFGNMSTSDSMWPVVIIADNLPPWKCIK